MERVEQVAASDVPVLILGETGSGKEVIARAIHTRSGRAPGPFVRVNCGAIPHDLIDSELFGHEKGAFTGAIETRPGWFERADGGTLLLDEVGELPPAAQVRLLRVLQEDHVFRVGGAASIDVDVRVIAATHRDLPVMVSEGRFREDLWYRLAVFPIRIPAIRERASDIPELARHLAAKSCARIGTRAIEPTDADIRLMASYPWPGNVREMGAVMDRAVILGGGDRLEIARALGVFDGPVAATPARDPLPVAGDGARIAPLDDIIRVHIERALIATAGRIEGPRGAARVLRVNPHTLRARMRRLGIDWAAIRRSESGKAASPVEE
jgi:transcriptional regulator with GAF, ATPase, and Fis domain